MAAPTFVAEYETAWTNANTRTTASFNVAAGDVLVCVCLTENHPIDANTPTNTQGAETWTLQTSTAMNNACQAYIWTATMSGAKTGMTVTVTTNATDNYGFNILHWTDTDGIGAASATRVASGAPSLGLTTTGDNSAICVGNADWNATDGTTRTWRSVNGSAATERSYFRDASAFTIYVGTHADAGTAGAKTVGLTAPTGQSYSIVAVEVLGSAGGATVHAASGVVAASSAVVGALTATLLAAGSVAGVSTVSGSVSRVPVVHAASGTVASASGAAGAVTARLGSAGSASVVSGSSGAVTSLRPTSGTVAATSGTSGSVSVLGGPVTHSASGVVAVTSSTAGQVTARLATSGTVAGVSSASGSASLLSGPAVWSVAGVVEAVSGATGVVTYVAGVSGTVDAASSVSGRVTSTADLSIVTPPERTIVVPAEDRTINVPAESRTVVVPADPRTLEA